MYQEHNSKKALSPGGKVTALFSS